MKKLARIFILIPIGLMVLDSTWSVGQNADTGKVFNKVYFDLNFENSPAIEPLQVEQGGYIKSDQKPAYNREGYRLAGWYISPNPVLTNGYSNEEWIFGERALEMLKMLDHSGLPNTMAVSENITLYARWVKPAKIKSISDLQAIQQDLKGWYVLENDIDLTGVEWKPIGDYDGTYEYAYPQWWQKAFQGIFEGNGHHIKNLTFRRAKNTIALFGAAVNCTIKDVSIDNYLIEFELKDEGDLKASYLYASPLIGFLHGESTVQNCHTSGKVNVSVEDSHSDFTFVCVSGIASGGWGGEINGCSVRGSLKLTTKSQNGGEIHVGGIVGEGYSTTVNCTSDLSINTHATSAATKADTEMDKHLDLYVGGLHGASTNIINSVANGTIAVSITKPKGKGAINVGGISGSPRYGFIENCASHVAIQIGEGREVHAGGIIGAFNTGGFGLIGLGLGIKRYEAVNCLATGKIDLGKNFKREKVQLGGIVSSIPDGIVSEYMGGNKIPINYRADHCVYVDFYNGATMSDATGEITKIADKKAATGDALKSILGSGWIYKQHELPQPYGIKLVSKK